MPWVVHPCAARRIRRRLLCHERERDEAEISLEALQERALAEGGAFVEWLDRNPQQLGPWQSHWLRGLALREAGRFQESLEALNAAAMHARGEDVDEARIRSSRSLVHLSVGDTDAALADADWAARHLTGAGAGRNENQRGVILFRQGRHRDALAALDRAESLLQDAGDRDALDRLRRNRAVLHATFGDLDAARADLEAAAVGARRTGNAVALGVTENNLGFVEGRAGDIPKALQHFTRAEESVRGVFDPARHAIIVVDRVEVLADAGLVDEALSRLAEAMDALDDGGERTVLAEAQLLAARLHRLRGQPEESSRMAALAKAGFEAAQRTGWAAKAAWVLTSAGHELGEVVDPIAARTLAHELADIGWHLESQALLLDASESAVARGDLSLARALVGELRRASRDAPAIIRIGYQRAVAGTRLALGDRAGARRAVTTGLKLLHEHRHAHGSAELRAHAGRHGQGLVVTALRMALEDDRADDALVALDRFRDTDQPRWSRPPTDPDLAGDLAELRRLDGVIRDSAREGLANRPAESSRAMVERRIRDRLRARPGPGAAPERLDVPELVGALDGRHLRSWFVHEGRVGVVSVMDGRRDLRLLGPLGEVQAELDSWRFSLRRLAEARGSAHRLHDAESTVRVAATRLVSLLGLDDHPPATPLVVVPTGSLRGVGWHSLDPLVGTSVAVVPSARHWLMGRQRMASGTRILLAAGPGLAAADREVNAAAAVHGAAAALTGTRASAAAVAEALDGAALGHLAAHGSFRWDNPLFSALQFADGPLWLHDFERLGRPPDTLVLSSCDMALDRVVAGDAVVGMASGLLRLGVSSLIAPVLPVPDEETADFMIALHERMAGGLPGSDALAATAESFRGDTPRREAVRQSFVSFGI